MNEFNVKTLDIKNSAGKTVGKNLTGEATIKNSAGSIDVSFKEVTGGIDNDCSAGSVNLTIPRNTNADVSLHSSAGSVKTNLPVTISGSNSHSKINGKLGSGGPMISADSSAGSVELNGN
jgi:DUF4097 and DUF4098 domain-containing protein YvlB